MRCPACACEETRVVDSRPVESGSAIRRRRSCEACDLRFTTYERAASVRMVRKRDGRLQPFDPAKLRAGVEAALAGRPVSGEAVDALIESIEAVILDSSLAISSEQLGRMALEGLRRLDQVASVRFASVYKGFEGAQDFERELAELEAVNRTD